MSVVINGTGSISGLSNVGGISSAQSGSVIQFVSSLLTTSFATTSNTPVATGLSLSITPRFSTSKIFVFVTGGTFDNQSAGGQQVNATLYRNSTNLAAGTQGNGMALVYSAAARIMTPVSVGVVDSPATTSATTYALYLSSTNTAGSIQLIASDSGTTMVAMEIAA